MFFSFPLPLLLAWDYKQIRTSEWNTQKHAHCVLDGIGGVGKSSLVLRFIKGTFRESYIPTIEDTYRQVSEHRKLVLFFRYALYTYIRMLCQVMILFYWRTLRHVSL